MELVWLADEAGLTQRACTCTPCVYVLHILRPFNALHLQCARSMLCVPCAWHHLL